MHMIALLIQSTEQKKVYRFPAIPIPNYNVHVYKSHKNTGMMQCDKLDVAVGFHKGNGTVCSRHIVTMWYMYLWIS